MPIPSTSVAFSLGAVLCWGMSDFLGGFVSRRADAYAITAITNGCGLAVIAVVCALSGTHMPPLSSMIWALAAGASGGTALAIFYRALAAGSMGLTAPVTALLSAGIPTVVGIVMEGWPHAWHVAGFILAGLAIWLISRAEGGVSPQGIGLAIVAGLGFAGFYLLIRQAQVGSAFWIAAGSRAAAFICTAAIVAARHKFQPMQKDSAAWAGLAGFLDVSGSVLFVRAAQTGRLDTSVVLTSLYPVVTVVLARLILKEHFTRWKTVGILTALAAVPLIAS